MRVSVGEAEAEASREIYLKHLSALVRGRGESPSSLSDTSIHEGACILSAFRSTAPQCCSLIPLSSSGPGQHLPVRAAWVSPRV